MEEVSQRLVGSSTPSTSNTSSARRNRQHRRPRRTLRDLPQIAALLANPIFLGLVGLLIVALAISFWLVLVHPDGEVLSNPSSASSSGDNASADQVPVVAEPMAKVNALEALPVEQQVQEDQGLAILDADALPDGPHLTPRLPHLPIFAEIPNGEQLAQDTIHGKPTIAGIAHILNRFTQALHDSNMKLASEQAELESIIKTYFGLANSYLAPLESAYRGKSVFPIREDDSIYMSLAAFREHLLSQTLKSAFDQAKNPHKLFIGAIVQNCFGNDGRQCRTGLQVVGKDDKGHDKVQQFDAPPDVNGIEEFCSDAEYRQYCDRGQIRALYIHDTDALGPAVARYYASKLWGGETYFLQMDSHLEFAPDWDIKYIQEAKAAKSFPKAVLSAYPPGFQNFGEYKGGTPGARLCTCTFSTNAVEANIIRINVGSQTSPKATRPTQIAFIAAGFFFARAEFLRDVPFDPYVPWCFMGEEIALSMRAWTQGWDIYAPRQNLIAHQYRPGRLGLPKFWESVGRESHRPNLNTRLQKHVIRRIKNLVGYPTDSIEDIKQAGDEIVLTDHEYYGNGKVRTREEYLTLTNIDVVKEECRPMHWCNHGELE